jgi:septal ring factor EnvC (AmiA/AmiB activator)
VPNPADQAKISALEKENADLRDNRVAMQLQLEELNVENARLNKQQRDQQASQLASQQHQQMREEDRVRIATLEQEKLALTKELQFLRRAAGDYEERMRKMGQTRAENEQLLVNFAERYSAEFLRMRNTVSANMSSPAGKAWLNKMRQENLRQAPGK